MKQKIIAWLFKYIPILAKKLWPHLKDSLFGDKTPNIVGFRDLPESNSVILFVHGFSGEAESTFGNIPQYLTEDKTMNGWNMFAVGYSSDAMPSVGVGIWAAIPDITKVSDFLITTLHGQFKKYSRIAIVAHSMGGLVVEKALLEIEIENRKKITDVMLFGTPSNGLVKARIVRWWNRQLRDMGHDGKFITNLRKKWDDTFNSTYPFAFKTVAGTNDEFVPAASSLDPFDKKYREVVSGNHLTIVKPENKNHAGYQLILATLSSTSFINTTDPESVNLLLGNYTAVINALLPNKDNLDERGTIKLVFALEGKDRKQEAKTVLEDYIKRDKNSTDMLGIMGGRYKREYLDGYKIADAEQAITFYKTAFDSSSARGNESQVFYHAINLAFLNLAYKNDTSEMEHYATIGQDAANKCPDEKWKFATIAEANIYLRKLEVSKEYYLKAAALADLREKESMFTNAYMAYTILYNTENEKDEVIKFLKTTLL